MKSNFELFAETWNLLKGKWLWRIMAVSLAMAMLLQLVGNLLQVAYRTAGITSLNGIIQDAAMEFARTGDYQLPPPETCREVLVSYGFELFISMIFGAIVAWGVANAALKATREDDHNWFSGAFDGFKNPLGFAWLQFVLNFRIFLWCVPYLLTAWIFYRTGTAMAYISCLPLLLLALVALYRYRLVWYLKNDYPELTASQCLAESARRMRGLKWKCFCFGLIYLGLLVAYVLVVGLLALAVAAIGSKLLGALLVLPLTFGTIFFFILWFVHLIVAHAVFYRNLPPQAGASAI